MAEQIAIAQNWYAQIQKLEGNESNWYDCIYSLMEANDFSCISTDANFNKQLTVETFFKTSLVYCTVVGQPVRESKCVRKRASSLISIKPEILHLVSIKKELVIEWINKTANCGESESLETKIKSIFSIPESHDNLSAWKSTEKKVFICMSRVLTTKSTGYKISELLCGIKFQSSNEIISFLFLFEKIIRQETTIEKLFSPILLDLDDFLLSQFLIDFLCKEQQYQKELETSLFNLTTDLEAFENSMKQEKSPIFSRILIIIWKRLMTIQRELLFGDDIFSIMWNAIIYILKMYPKLIKLQTNRGVNPILLCTLYATLKITIKGETKFQQITKIWKETISNDSSDYLEIVGLMNGKKNDIIQFYNENFISTFERLFRQIEMEFTTKIPISIVTYPMLSKIKWRIVQEELLVGKRNSMMLNERVSVAVSPRKRSKDSRRPSFFYSFGDTEKSSFSKKLLF